jgi:hypothetical protein
MNFEKIYCILYQHKQLLLKLHVKLLKENGGRVENFHQVFSYGEKNYLKLDLQSFLTFELKEKDDIWDKSKTILINDRNIYQIIHGFKKMVKNIYKGGVFAIDSSNEIIMYSDKVEENTVHLYYIGGSQRLILAPCIIYDSNSISYEGCIIYINNKSNYVQFTIDELEALYYILKKINIFTYSIELLNYYMLSANKVNISNTVFKSNEKERPKYNIFTDNDKSKIESKLMPKITDEDFFGFK